MMGLALLSSILAVAALIFGISGMVPFLMFLADRQCHSKIVALGNGQYQVVDDD